MDIVDVKVLCSIIMALLGIVIIIADINLYPSSLPKVIDGNNAPTIQTQSYIFYIVLILGMAITSSGIRIITKLPKEYNNIIENNTYNYSRSRSLHSLFNIFVTIAIISHINDKRLSMFFWSTAVGYGLFFSATSGILIYRAEGLSHDYGMVTVIPSVTIMSYGPIGYVPTLAIAITENIGFLVIPINLIIMLIVSILVGYNAMLSAYAFKIRPKKKKNANSNNRILSSTSFSSFGLIGAAMGLFTACPTCASLFIFNFILGSFASTIATFTAAFYGFFVAVTIPLLLVTPIMTVLGIRKMHSTNAACAL
jgi:hypothetical protein